MKFLEQYLPFREPLAALQRLIEAYQSRGMVMGGLAVSILGVPRLTVDIDALFLLSVGDFPKFLKDAKQEGFLPRTPDVEEFAKKKSVVLLIHEESGIGIDISMGQLPFEQEAVQRSQLVNVGGLDVRLISVEDLIITKAIAHRPQDLQDIASLLELNPKIDKGALENGSRNSRRPLRRLSCRGTWKHFCRTERRKFSSLVVNRYRDLNPIDLQVYSN